MDAVESLKDHIEGCRRVEIDIRDVVRGGFRAKKVDFRAEMEKPEMKGIDLIRVVEEAAADLGLREEAKRFASKTVRTLVSAEAKLHGTTIREVHLHEAGMFDTPAEIVGSAVALEGLGLFGSTRPPSLLEAAPSSSRMESSQARLQQPSRFSVPRASRWLEGPLSRSLQPRRASRSWSTWWTRL
ncbi:DUF111 family protein [Candidatus Bathyarchaeota archaeon]|nr:MAG: DUF111 family protein [Candidatus Bathyarchaeota archaeon]